ncbi:hypothetical protein Tco_0462526, partial [Tanacetum coccineum]
IMADLNIPANDAPVEQAPAVAPPTRTDDQILPLSKWVPIGKSNCVLDVHKPQRNPIFPIAVALLKNTNFFRAFTASSTIPAIYIQQFWDTMCFNTSTGLYSCQLDEQWFNLHKDLLRDALDITPTNDNNPFVAPPSSDTVIEYVNTLGYPSTLRNVSAMSVNALYQPWRAVLSMINMCLTGKTAGYDRPRHHVLQILWGIIHRSNIDYAERIWEEFVQSIQTFLTDRKNLTTASRGKKKTAHLLIPNVRFTKLIIHHLRTKHNIHPRTGSPLHYSHEESILNTLMFVGKDGREIFSMPIPDALLTDEIKGAPYYNDYQEHAAKVTKPAGDKAPKPTATQPPKAKPAPTQPSKAVSEKKQKLLVDKPSDEGVPVEEYAHTDEEADLQRALELKVQGKGKEKVIDEQAAYDLLTLQTLMKKSPLPLTDSKTESDEEVPVINAGDQDEGQARPNPEQMDEEFTITAYPNVQENLKLPTKDQKPHEEESRKMNAKIEVQSMVSVPIHQDTSSVPPMTTPVIDLTTTQSDSLLPTSTATISTITTTTTTLPSPPPQPQQSTAYLILVKRIGELEQHMADLIQNNLALEERLDKQGSRLYNLENLNIPHKVSQAVDEIVTDAVDWAHEVHNDLYEALQKSLELDYLNQRLADQEEARKKKRKKRAAPRTHYGSPPSPPPPLPPLAGASGALCISRTSGSSQLPPPPPPPFTGASGSAQQIGSEAPSSSKPVASTYQSMSWTTSDTRFESTDYTIAQELPPTDFLIQDDSIPDEQVHLSDDEDSGNDHLPKAD